MRLAAFLQIAELNVLATHALRRDEGTVRAVVHAIVAGAKELDQINPLFAGLAELMQPLRSAGSAALQFGGVALHRGALCAFREALA